MAEESKLPPPDQPLVPPPGIGNLAGTTFGGYRIIKKIAQGGMGVIYEAIQLRLDRKVALKILTEPLAAQPEFFQRFEREAKAAAALNHPNVVQVHDFGEAEGRHFIIMEFVEGQNLSHYVGIRGPLPVNEALGLIEQAAGALKAAAEKSIVHRDIKPSNLMLTNSGVVKVADLGLARVTTQQSDLTMSNIVGSPHFIAPEQAADSRTVDHRVDIYSLGLTLYFLLTGKYPYDGNSPISIVLAHSQKPLPNPADFGVKVPDEVMQLIHRMSAKEPEDRYQDYDSLLADLRAVKSGHAPVIPPPAPRPAPPSPTPFAEPQPTPVPTATSLHAPGSSRKELMIAVAVLAGVVIFAAVCIILVLSKRPAEKVAAQPAPFGQTEPSGPGPSGPPQGLPENAQPPQQGNFQPPQQQGGGQNGFQPPMFLVMSALDLNHNRTIDRDEMDAAPTSLKTLDRNGDGKLEPDEYLGQSDLSRGDYKMFRLYQALHPDANGVIGPDSLAKAPAALKALDTNGDGMLGPDEFGPPGAPTPSDMNQQGGQGGPGGPGGPPQVRPGDPHPSPR